MFIVAASRGTCQAHWLVCWRHGVIVLFSSCSAVLWRFIPFATVWSIWKEMNDRIFTGERMGFNDLLSVMSWRLAKWLSLGASLLI